MNIEHAASAFLILVPIAFNAFFFLLARLFNYPDILRSPTASILSRYRAGGVRLKLVWYGFMLTAILLALLAVFLGQVLARYGLAIVPTATVVGVLAAIVQFLGLARWPFLVPSLGRKYDDPASSESPSSRTPYSFSRAHARARDADRVPHPLDGSYDDGAWSPWSRRSTSDASLIEDAATDRRSYSGYTVFGLRPRRAT